MLILLFVIAVIAMIVSIVSYKRKDTAERFTGAVISTFVSIALLVAICLNAPKVATAYTIDEKISMYQEQNEKIEQNIDQIVQRYMEHEKDVYMSLKPEDSSITLVTLFPELKSDELVQEQVSLYWSNNIKITNLKEQKIDIAKLRWILYFGK